MPAARFIMAEVDIGLPTLVGSYILESHVFHSRMVEIVLTGRPILAAEAAEIGLVHRIVEPERLTARRGPSPSSWPPSRHGRWR